MGWDWGWVMTFPLVSSLGWGVEYDRPSLNPFLFFGENFFASCLDIVMVDQNNTRLSAVCWRLRLRLRRWQMLSIWWYAAEERIWQLKFFSSKELDNRIVVARYNYHWILVYELVARFTSTCYCETSQTGTICHKHPSQVSYHVMKRCTCFN